MHVRIVSVYGTWCLQPMWEIWVSYFCLHVYACMCAMYAYIHLCAGHATHCIHTKKTMHTHAHTYTRTHQSSMPCLKTCNKYCYLYTRTHAYSHTYMYAFTHTYIHTCTHTQTLRVDTYITQTHTCTHTHTGRLPMQLLWKQHLRVAALRHRSTFYSQRFRLLSWLGEMYLDYCPCR